MASPWKFLARLLSPRRQQTQGNDSIEDVSPGVLPIAGSPGRPQPFDESAALSAARGPSKKETSDFHTTLERDSAPRSWKTAVCPSPMKLQRSKRLLEQRRSGGGGVPEEAKQSLPFRKPILLLAPSPTI